MEKKKITILSAAYPFRGGIAHFTGLLYKELTKSHEVTIITFKRQYPKIFFPGKTQLESESEQIQKIPTHTLVDSINPFNWRSIGKKIKKESPDLLIINFWLPFFGAAFGTISKIVKGNKHTKVIIICHNIIPHEKRILDIQLTKFLFTYADYFILLTQKLERELLLLAQKAPYKILFHPVYSIFGTAVDKNKAREFLRIPNKPTLLFFGIVREYKGLDTLLNAFALLKDRLDASLVIAGEFYSNELLYRRMIKYLNISDNTFVYNQFIPTSEVTHYFSSADVVVLPYKDATQSGIVQIANNFDKPVIATNVGGLGEVVLDNRTGYLVEKNNPEQLANAIFKFFSEHKEKEFTDTVKIETGKYSWEKFVTGIFELIGNS